MSYRSSPGVFSAVASTGRVSDRDRGCGIHRSTDLQQVSRRDESRLYGGYDISPVPETAVG